MKLNNANEIEMNAWPFRLHVRLQTVCHFTSAVQNMCLGRASLFCHHSVVKAIHETLVTAQDISVFLKTNITESEILELETKELSFQL